MDLIGVPKSHPSCLFCLPLVLLDESLACAKLVGTVPVE